MYQDTNATRGAHREDRPPLHDTIQGGRLYWVREPGVRVRSGSGLQHPVLTQLARGRVVTADTDATLAAHTRTLMAMALCESGARTARDNGGELVCRFEPRQWDRLFRNTLGDPPNTWTPEKCYVTSWGVGHATFGCANARAFRDWLQADPTREYETL